MSAKDDARSHVDTQWRSSREIQNRIGAWARTTIRHALDELAREGHVEYRIAPKPKLPFGVAEYRIATAPAETGKPTENR
jgi:hypothetical protein